MEDEPIIELPEKIYNRLEMLLKLKEWLKENIKFIWLLVGAYSLGFWEWIVSLKPKYNIIQAVEFVDKDGKPFQFFLGEKLHIDNHRGAHPANPHCIIKPIIKISISKDKVKVLYEGEHQFIYSQVSIRTIYLKKV
jgi:hypothetical protein